MLIFLKDTKLADKEKEEKELMTKEEKKSLAIKRKEIREEMKAKYGKGVIDGKEVEIGNYMAEPPGIFMGRGEHPMRGRIQTTCNIQRCNTESW